MFFRKSSIVNILGFVGFVVFTLFCRYSCKVVMDSICIDRRGCVLGSFFMDIEI